MLRACACWASWCGSSAIEAATGFARRGRSPELLARAALARAPGFFASAGAEDLGGRLESSSYAPELIAALDEALECVSADELALRARLLSRRAIASIGGSSEAERARDRAGGAGRGSTESRLRTGRPAHDSGMPRRLRAASQCGVAPARDRCVARRPGAVADAAGLLDQPAARGRGSARGGLRDPRVRAMRPSRGCRARSGTRRACDRCASSCRGSSRKRVRGSRA